MKLKIQPVNSLRGEIFLPASKSYSIRSFIAASCGGTSTIINPSDCDDALVSMKAARALGSRINNRKNIWKVEAGASSQAAKIDVGESGTVLRLVLPLLAWRGKRAVVTGKGTLIGRPNAFLLQTLRRMGALIRGSGDKESVPIKIGGGTLRAGRISIDGSLSSQFVSALLMVCPLMPKDSELTIEGQRIVSTDYITMTRQILELSGIKMQKLTERIYKIKGGQKYKGLKRFVVPSDYGLAAFFMAGAAVLKSDVFLRGELNDRLIQADGEIFPLLKRMGVRFAKTASGIKMKGPFKIKGGRFSLKNAPDLVPIATVLSLFAQSKVTLYDIAHVRAKESDRISDLRRELLKVGAKIEETADALTIYPQKSYQSGRELDPHRDHRLAMAFCILGLKIGVAVKDIECTAKSYPGFVRDLRRLAPSAIK